MPYHYAPHLLCAQCFRHERINAYASERVLWCPSFCFVLMGGEVHSLIHPLDVPSISVNITITIIIGLPTQFLFSNIETKIIDF